MKEPFKASFKCQGCKKWFFDYIAGNSHKDDSGSYVSKCNDCSRIRRKYRQDHPDQQLFNFGGTNEAQETPHPPATPPGRLPQNEGGAGAGS